MSLCWDLKQIFSFAAVLTGTSEIISSLVFITVSIYCEKYFYALSFPSTFSLQDLQLIKISSNVFSKQVLQYLKSCSKVYSASLDLILHTAQVTYSEPAYASDLLSCESEKQFFNLSYSLSSNYVVDG